MLLALALTATLTTAAAPPRNVYAGVYLNDVSDFDLKAGRFKADLRVWVKWLGKPDEVPELLFENGELDVQDALGKESDGDWNAAQWHVQGTFRGEFPLQAFPFDHQKLPIVLSIPGSHGVLVPDLGSSGMRPSFSITGWNYDPFFSASAEERVLRSDLGSVEYEGKGAHQRITTFTVEMHRPFGPYLLKFALPLALILIVALLALFLPADRLDVRSAMGITALLSCFAFHYTQADTLPSVTYLVAADKLFLGSYVFLSGTLVLSILSYRLFEKHPDFARRADRIGIWGLPAVTLLSLFWLVTSSTAKLAPVKVVPPAVAARASEAVLRVAVSALDSPALGQQVPSVRSPLVVKTADGGFLPLLADEAPAMTNELVRLLPDGGMRVRWQLRPGAKWSDGSEITVTDLEFSINAVVQPQRTTVERVDEHTIDVTYSQRRSEWLSGFTLFQAAKGRSLPDAGRDALSRATSEGTLPTAGNYTLSKFEKGKTLELVRNPRARVVPTFEKVQVSVMTAMDAAQALLKNEVDVVPTLTGDSYELLKHEKSVRVLEQPGELLWVIVPRVDVPPFDSLEARRGLLAALDREAMVKELLPSPVRVASGWRAKPVMKVPSAPALEKLTVKLNVAPIHSADETHGVLANKIVSDLARVGVTVQIVERDDLQQAVQRRDFEGLALVSRDTSDPGRFMNARWEEGRLCLEKADGAHFDDEMVERYEYWVSSLYAERRDFLSSAMQEAWFKRLPMVPLVLTSRLAAVRAELVGPEWGVADTLWWNVADWHH